MTNFDRAFTLITGDKIEGGLSLDPQDPGNWTGGEIGKGILKGTNHGISAKQYPNEDIPNLSLERAKFLFNRDYWLLYKCDTLEWGKALAVFDTAVNGGPVHGWLEKFSRLPLEAFLIAWQTEHIIYLSGLRIWPREARGWMVRMFTVYNEARKVV